MTDKEIVQALRRCQFGAPCARCPAVSNKNCMDEMHKCAADLIERLTAENTALREGASLGKAKRPQKKAYEKSIEFLRALTDGQSDEIKSLRRELEGNDMVIALTQRKQAEAEAERDAALADLADARSCKTCKYACDTRDCSSCKSKTCKCRECHLDKNAWEWRGLPEAPEEGGKA
jgi:hypothetical protein